MGCLPTYKGKRYNSLKEIEDFILGGNASKVKENLDTDVSKPQDIEAQKADIDRRRKEELDEKVNNRVDRFGREKKFEESLDENQEIPSYSKIGSEHKEGNKIEVTFIDNTTDGFSGNPYSMVVKVVKPEVHTDGVMTQSGSVEVGLFDSKEAAEEWLQKEKNKDYSKQLDKKAKQINAKYDAELEKLKKDDTKGREQVQDSEKREDDNKGADAATSERPAKNVGLDGSVGEGSDVASIKTKKAKEIKPENISKDSMSQEVYSRVRSLNTEIGLDEADAMSAHVVELMNKYPNNSVDMIIEKAVKNFVKAKKKQSKGKLWNPRINIPVNKEADGSKATKPSRTYNEGVTSGKKNIWVRQSDSKSNKGRKLMVQFSSELLYGERKIEDKDVSNKYFDRLYSKIKGYDRTVDFWEVPLWMSRIAYIEPNADVYVVRNMDEFNQMVKEAGYDNILFSELDVNKAFIQEIVDANPNVKFTLGTYTKSNVKGDNVSTYNTVSEYAKQAGIKDIEGYDYRHFKGLKVIPRIKMSEGCRYKCAFCTVPKKVNSSTKEVIQQQIRSIQDLDATLVYLDDKTFGQADNYEYLTEVYKEVKKYNPDFEGFVIQTTSADFASKKFTPKFLAESGIKYVELGVETYNDEILNKLNKKHSAKKLTDKAMNKARRNNIKIIPNVIVGLTWKENGETKSETRETYQNTIDFINKNRDVISHINVYSLSLYEGTELSDSIESKVDSDKNENVIEKSFHSDSDVHAWAMNEFTKIASETIDGEFTKKASETVDGKTTRESLEKQITELAKSGKIKATPKQIKAAFKIYDAMAKTYKAVTGKDNFWDKFGVQLAEGVRGLKQEAQMFKSTALEGLGKINQKAAKPEAWVKMISEKGGRGTSQELNWIGLSDFLKDYIKENKVKSVPKDVVEQYIKDNQIEIVEVGKTDINNFNYSNWKDSEQKSDFDIQKTGRRVLISEDGYKIIQDKEGGYDLFSPNGEKVVEDERSLNQIKERYNYIVKKSPTKYSEYTLGGGKNYREFLLTFPNDIPNLMEYNLKLVEYNNLISEIGLDRPTAEQKQKANKLESELNNLKETLPLDKLRKTNGTNFLEKKGDEYNSGHWDEPNILAHLRINERTLPNGERVMFIEEVQSDWAQEGKKEGFKDTSVLEEKKEVDKKLAKIRKEVDNISEKSSDVGLNIKTRERFIKEHETKAKDPLNEKIEELEKELTKARNNNEYKDVETELNHLKKQLEEKYPLAYNLTEKELGILKTELNSLQEEKSKLDKKGNEIANGKESTDLKSRQKELVKKLVAPIPDMPYKKTDQWVGMAMRRALKMAADEGFDRVAWVTGEQSADRYDLAEQVESIETTKNPDGTYQVIVLPIGGGAAIESFGSTDALKVPEDKLEDIVGKELASKIIEDSKENEENTYAGEGLKAGGEGMKAFYNSILPNAAKKEAQRFDKKAKVEVVDFNKDAGIGNLIKKPVNEFEDSGAKFVDYKTDKGYAVTEITNKRSGEITYNVYDSNDLQVARNISKLEDVSTKSKEAITSKTASKQLSIAITPKMRMNLNSAIPLFQEAKGAISISEAGNFVELFEKADVSTILHEFVGGHLGRRVLEALAEENNDFKEHYDNVKKWAGAEKGWSVKAEEKFARAWERYMRTGNSPTKSLQAAFDVLSTALKKIYNVIKGSSIDVKIPKEIKDAFDNMLAYNEINKANAFTPRINKAKTGLNKKTGVAEGIRSHLESILSINPRAIPERVMSQYNSILDTLGERRRVLDLKGLRSDVAKVVDAINEDNSLVPDLKSRYESFPKKETYGKTINAMLNEDIISAEEADVMRRRKGDIAPSETREKKETKTSKEIAEEIETRPNNVQNKHDSTKADELIRLSTKERLGKMSKTDLSSMQRVFDNIENGIFTKFANDMLNKLKNMEGAENIAPAVDKAKSMTPLDDLRAMFKNLIASKRSVSEYKIRQNPLFDIDNTLGNTNKTTIRDNTFGKMASAYSKLRTEINKLSEKLIEADARMLKEVKGDSNKLSYSKAKVMAYMLQKEHEANPDGKTISAIDAIDDNIKTIKSGQNPRYGKQDLKMFEQLKAEVNGLKAKDYKLSEAQKFTANTIQKINESNLGIANHVASVIRGNSRFMYTDYVHHVAIRNKQEESDRLTKSFNNFFSPSTKAGSVEERKGGTPILFDPIASTSSGTRELLTDYYMTDVSRQVKGALNLLAKEAEDGSIQQEIYNSMGKVFDTVMETVFMGEMQEISQFRKALQALEKMGYKVMLASIPRAAAELGSNVTYALIANPKDFAKGMEYISDIMNDDYRTIMELVGSGVTERLHGKKLSSKYVEIGMFADKDKTNKQKYSNEVFNKMKQINYYASKFTTKPVSRLAEGLISTPDKLVSRTLWNGALTSEFKRNTGKDMNPKDILNPEFLKENKKELEKAARYADREVIRAVTSDNIFDGVVKNQIHPKDDMAVRMWKKTNSFMAKFNIFEYMTVRQGVLALMKSGDISTKKGLALITAAHARMTSYMVLLGMTNYVFDMAIHATGLFGGEPPEEPDPKEVLRYSIGSAATSLFARNFGNIAKIPVTMGVEYANEKWGDFMRDGEYDKFDDSIMFTIVASDDFKSGESEKVAAKFSAAYRPLLQTLISTYNNVTKLSDKNISEDTYEKTKENLVYRSGLEMMGNLGMIPIYKDIRRNALRSLYTSPLRPKEGESMSAYRNRMGDKFDEKNYYMYKGSYHKEILKIDREKSNIYKALKLIKAYDDYGSSFKREASEYFSEDVIDLSDNLKGVGDKFSDREIKWAYSEWSKIPKQERDDFGVQEIKRLLNERKK
jgi:tRNA A37 methylthiotransferase MiaB